MDTRQRSSDVVHILPRMKGRSLSFFKVKGQGQTYMHNFVGTKQYKNGTNMNSVVGQNKLSGNQWQ